MRSPFRSFKVLSDLDRLDKRRQLLSRSSVGGHPLTGLPHYWDVSLEIEVYGPSKTVGTYLRGRTRTQRTWDLSDGKKGKGVRLVSGEGIGSGGKGYSRDVNRLSVVY